MLYDVSTLYFETDQGDGFREPGFLQGAAAGAQIIRTARRYRTIQIQAGQHVITAADPLPDDLRQALEAITHAS